MVYTYYTYSLLNLMVLNRQNSKVEEQVEVTCKEGGKMQN